MKRLNPETGKPFKRGAVGEDGRRFYAYRTSYPVKSDGYFQEHWLSADAYPRRVGPSGRNSQLKYKYGITSADYDRMNFAQGGACMICREPPPSGKNLYVDHCHNSGRVRGLLCQQCNTMIGMAERHEHAQEVLRRGAEYISLLAPHSLPELWEQRCELSLQRSAPVLPLMPSVPTAPKRRPALNAR